MALKTACLQDRHDVGFIIRNVFGVADWCQRGNGHEQQRETGQKTSGQNHFTKLRDSTQPEVST